MFYFGILVIVIITGVYASMLLWLYFGTLRMPEFNSLSSKPKTSISIIIALRNEAENLPRLLQSLAKLNYPKNLFEILFVDDASSDNSKEIIKEFKSKFPELQVQLLSNVRRAISPKKDAITTAVKQSNKEWIITTDADCEVPENWLGYYDAFIGQNNAVFIAGPVAYKSKKGFLYHFQLLDWASLVGTTIGSFFQKKPIMCSGANLAYKKEVFDKVNGFQGNEHIASGDDVFLLQKMNQKYSSQVFFMNAPNAIVKTQPLSTWRAVYQQRIRWAKKTSNIPSLFTKMVGICVFSMNFLLIVLLLISIFNAVWIPLLIFGFTTKLLVDTLLLKKTLDILQTRISLTRYISASLLYPFFVSSVVFVSIFSNYRWKGRNFTK